jgi:hypothetical protein
MKKQMMDVLALAVEIAVCWIVAQFWDPSISYPIAGAGTLLAIIHYVRSRKAKEVIYMPGENRVPTNTIYCNRCGSVNTSGHPNCVKCQQALAWWKR